MHCKKMNRYFNSVWLPQLHVNRLTIILIQHGQALYIPQLSRIPEAWPTYNSRSAVGQISHLKGPQLSISGQLRL